MGYITYIEVDSLKVLKKYLAYNEARNFICMYLKSPEF
jgi:predicted transport protein